MAKASKRIRVRPGSELASLLEEVAEEPVFLEKDGEVFCLHRAEETEEAETAIGAGYDPAKVREAIAKYAGTWADLDTGTLIADIYRARREGSRAVDRP